MSNLEALLLGVVQGLTEFLPISSSGHLIIVPWLQDYTFLTENEAFNKTFDVALHAGTLVADEIKVLERLTHSTKRPYAVVLGGSKVSDKLGVIEALATKADSIVIGGGMCFTFLAAQGYSVGKSLLEEDMIETCRGLLDTYGDVLRLPVDIVVTEKFAADSPPQTVAANEIPDDLLGLDIGPGSVKRFTTLLSNAQTVFWNGPMGVFEFPEYAAGTRGVAEAIAVSIRRPGDVAARYGGEEFAVVLPGTDEAGAMAVAANIQRAVRELRIEHGGSEWGHVTVSAGIASSRPTRSGMGSDALLREADGALYLAKRRGRNGAALASALSATDERRVAAA